MCTSAISLSVLFILVAKLSCYHGKYNINACILISTGNASVVILETTLLIVCIIRSVIIIANVCATVVLVLDLACFDTLYIAFITIIGIVTTVTTYNIKFTDTGW